MEAQWGWDGFVCLLSVVSDRGRRLTRGQLLCPEILRDVIPQGCGKQKNRRVAGSREDGVERRPCFISITQREQSLVNVRERDGGETLLTGIISTQLHGSGRTPKTSHKMPNQERHLKAAKVDPKLA